MGEHQLERMGVEVEHLQEILLDILLLRVQEELENLNDIFSGEEQTSILPSPFKLYQELSCSLYQRLLLW